MPPKKRKAPKNVSSGGSDDEDYRKKRDRNNQNDTDGEGDEYRKKRERNNEAVKRSRVKSKQRATETKGRVDDLKESNQKLEAAIRQKQDTLKMVKDMFLETARIKTIASDNKNHINLQKLLADSDDEDTPGGSGTHH